MFGFIKRIKSRRNLFLYESLELFEKGDFSKLKDCYVEIVDMNKNKEYIRRLGKALTLGLSKMSCREKIHLSENLKNYTSIEWYCDWTKFEPESLSYAFDEKSSIEDFESILIIGSICSNGYYREKCLRLLHDSQYALPFVILRLNDWVENIRSIAEEIAMNSIKNMPVSRIMAILPYLEKVSKSLRRDSDKLDQFNKLVFSRIRNDITKNDISELSSINDSQTKKSIYKMLFSTEAMTSELARIIIGKEKNKFLQSYVKCKFIHTYHYTIDVSELDVLLNDRNYNVRYLAAQYKYKNLNNIWHGAEELLLDKSRSIREFAVFIFNKHTELDVLEFYRKKLKNDNGDSTLAINGIGECGSFDDAEYLKKYLNSENLKTVSETIMAIQKLTGDKSADVYWDFLFDDRIHVSKTAYLAISKCKAIYGSENVYNALINCQSKHTKRYLVLILVNEDSWQRLPYLLKLYNYDCLQLRYLVRNAIEKRNPYARLSKDLFNKINQVIFEERHSLPDELVCVIELSLKHIMR